MMRPYVQVGSVHTVYHHRPDLDTNETCDLGCKHKVYTHEVKRITVTSIESVFIKALHYVSDGWGNEYTATDAQGRTYKQRDSWDGPSGWVRENSRTVEYFARRPFLTPAKDVYGRLI